MLQTRVRLAFVTADRNSSIQKLQHILVSSTILCLFPTLNFTIYFIQSGTVGSTFSMSAPITKVVKNDAYTAPRPPVPVAPTRPNTSMPAARSSAAASQPVSRTLQQSTAETSTSAPAPPQVIHSHMQLFMDSFQTFVSCSLSPSKVITVDEAVNLHL